MKKKKFIMQSVDVNFTLISFSRYQMRNKLPRKAPAIAARMTACWLTAEDSVCSEPDSLVAVGSTSTTVNEVVVTVVISPSSCVDVIVAITGDEVFCVEVVAADSLGAVTVRKS